MTKRQLELLMPLLAAGRAEEFLVDENALLVAPHESARDLGLAAVRARGGVQRIDVVLQRGAPGGRRRAERVVGSVLGCRERSVRSGRAVRRSDPAGRRGRALAEIDGTVEVLNSCLREVVEFVGLQKLAKSFA